MKTAGMVRDISKISGIAGDDLEYIKKTEEKYPFCSNEYYLSLIDWKDKNDPIRRIIIPDPRELDSNGSLDPSGESDNTVVKGVQHKYGPTALMIVSESCGSVCRYCFRKRIFLDTESEKVGDFEEAFDYIRNNPGISNVLLTGGDPLMLPTSALERIIATLRKIDHVKIIRIGSRMPAFNPFRILNDQPLLRMIEKYSTDERRIYIMTHFSHPRELNADAVSAVSSLIGAGAVLANQTPLLRGVNDDPEVLSRLFNRLAETGITPYYLFQCRPTAGNCHFSVPVEEGYGILEDAKIKCSGLAKRVKFIMSHKSGKIEILASDEKYTYMKYHQAAQASDDGRFMVFAKNPGARWLEDYGESV